MDWLQVESFYEGPGRSFYAADLLGLIQAVGVGVVFLFVAWLLVLAYNDYTSSSISINDMIIIWARSLGMMSVLLYLLVKF